MTGADQARQRRRFQAKMGAMTGLPCAPPRNETQSRVRRGLLYAALALALGAACSIDDRNVQNTSEGAGGASGTEVEAGEGSGSAPLEGGSGSAPTGAAAPPFTDTASGNAGLPGASGSGAAGSEGGGNESSGSEGTGGACTAGAQRCQDGTVQVCNTGGMWASLGTACGECVPDATECAGSTLRVCSSVGVWIDRLQCPSTQPVCQAATGRCVCDESSCPLGQLCSSETFSCVEQSTDCPVPSPIPPSEDLDIGIISVRFDDATGSADVRIQNIGTGVVFFAAALCNGPDNCVVLRDGVTLQLNPRDTLDVTIPDTRPAGGELALLNDFPENAITGFAYVAWGSGPASDQLESLANAFEESWRPGQRITVAPGDTGFVSTGNSNVAAGYTSCNPLRFTP